MVAEVKEIHSARDLTDGYRTKEFLFLSSGGFVEMDKKTVHKTGSWELENTQLEIRYDNASTAEKFETELVSEQELLLFKDSLQFRLLRL